MVRAFRSPVPATPRTMCSCKGLPEAARLAECGAGRVRTGRVRLAGCGIGRVWTGRVRGSWAGVDWTGLDRPLVLLWRPAVPFDLT